MEAPTVENKGMRGKRDETGLKPNGHQSFMFHVLPTQLETFESKLVGDFWKALWILLLDQTEMISSRPFLPLNHLLPAVGASLLQMEQDSVREIMTTLT